jgi:hypothetical protein
MRRSKTLMMMTKMSMSEMLRIRCFDLAMTIRVIGSTYFMMKEKNSFRGLQGAAIVQGLFSFCQNASILLPSFVIRGASPLLNASE